MKFANTRLSIRKIRIRKDIQDLYSILTRVSIHQMNLMQ
ncbi:hypothetical protein LEP1GSC060_0795 [Leptospira weilii serovar Ranarum str. ICFT]|uniref:Uncharacterized protein n=1 Tax=Leptospira weilii serovar Ranarum str. ICFT TaxID=1218598 RepID=N1WPB2_9LEPT|nr:hypothetical protein LEP1GSC060_0795 [Leptospira weilii serovar Ranarum str. ICFT]